MPTLLRVFKTIKWCCILLNAFAASLEMIIWFVILFFYCILGFGVHVQNMQDSGIGTHVAVWFAAFLPFTHIWHFSPGYPSPAPPRCPSPIPPNRPQCLVLPLCVHVFSFFITHLWERICGISFSVLVSVCWEWWFPGSTMSLQRTSNHSFYGCIVFHGVYVPHFSCPVYCQWAFGLVPGLCYCKQCHYEHMCACVFTIEWFIILWVYAQ